MSGHTCPKCGQPGGVPMLFSVAPCDACCGRPRQTKTGGRRWVWFGPGDVPGSDWIGWNAHSYSNWPHTATDEQIESARALSIERFSRLPDPNSALTPRLNGGYSMEADDGRREGLIEMSAFSSQDRFGWALAGDPP